MRNTIILATFLILSIWTADRLRALENSDKDFYSARRQKVMKKIKGSVALLEGASETRSYDRFRQDNNFYYLTGVETPGAFLLLDALENRSILFLPARGQTRALWEGEGIFAQPEARQETGVDEVLEVSKLGQELGKRKASMKPLYIPLSPAETAATSRDRAQEYESERKKNPWDGRISREEALAKNLKRILGDSLEINDLSPILDSMRRVKDAQEIDRMRQAAMIGASGIKEAMKATRPGRYEYQIAAMAGFLFGWNGALGPAYFPIVGSGPNSCVLHYHEDTRKMESGDMVVMDFGPDYKYYSSDITRSFPVSGRFTAEQAKIYQIVLDAQKAALEKVGPGTTFAMVANAAKEVLTRAGYEKYLLHGVSHYVGLATHDVGKIEPLEAGVVLTVEPGVYIREKNLGIRIEDTVLVTKDGYEILSRDVPKEISEIERLMAEKVALPAD